MGPLKFDHNNGMIILTVIILSGFHCTWFEFMQDASVNSLKAMDIVSHDDPSFTDQFMELLPNLENKFAVNNF